jgi:hypothetical protein
MRRVEANDAASIYVLGSNNYQGLNGFQQDHVKGLELSSVCVLASIKCF